MSPRSGVGAGRLTALAVALLVVQIGCADRGTAPGGAEEFVAEASDFECLTAWPRVRTLRLTNRLGYLDEALALAQNPEAGRRYPVGTIIQIFPGEAMVKRGGGYDPENDDWEYFELAVSRDGTEIRKRGRDDVINMFGGQCFGCHSAAREFDFICEHNHGCIELPIGGEQIVALQNLDPRCGGS